MASVTALDAERTLQIEAGTIVGAHIDTNGDLILTRKDGGTYNAGGAQNETNAKVLTSMDWTKRTNGPVPSVDDVGTAFGITGSHVPQIIGGELISPEANGPTNWYVYQDVPSRVAAFGGEFVIKDDKSASGTAALMLQSGPGFVTTDLNIHFEITRQFGAVNVRVDNEPTFEQMLEPWAWDLPVNTPLPVAIYVTGDRVDMFCPDYKWRSYTDPRLLELPNRLVAWQEVRDTNLKSHTAWRKTWAVGDPGTPRLPYVTGAQVGELLANIYADNGNLQATAPDGDIEIGNVLAGQPGILLGASRIFSLGASPNNVILPKNVYFGEGIDTALSWLAQFIIGTSTGTSFKVEGTWNGGHFLMGNYHIWVDSTGRPRIKSSAPTSDTDGIIIGHDAGALASGESTISRQMVHFGQTVGSLSLGTSSLRGGVFTARKTETVTKVKMVTGTTAAAATPTLCKMGVYLEDPSTGNFSKVGETANDTTLFAAASTQYTRNLLSSFEKVAGQRYAVCALVVSAASAPTLSGVAGNIEDSVAPRLTVRLDTQSDLPSSFTAASQTLYGHKIYGVLLP